MKEEKNFILPEELGQMLLKYLSTRPYIEVMHFVPQLQKLEVYTVNELQKKEKETIDLLKKASDETAQKVLNEKNNKK